MLQAGFELQTLGAVGSDEDYYRMPIPLVSQIFIFLFAQCQKTKICELISAIWQAIRLKIEIWKKTSIANFL